MIKQFLIIMLFLIIAGAGVLFWTEIKTPKNNVNKDNELVVKMLKEDQPEKDTSRTSVDLFFAHQDKSLLVTETREIWPTESGEGDNQQVQQALLELIKGPMSDKHAPTVPPETKVRGFYIDKQGTGYVDFSSELIQNHQMGSWGEMITIYSIVNTITRNFPKIHKVRLLINGAEAKTLGGHLDINRTFSYNESLLP